jgi:hypothetical protein
MCACPPLEPYITSLERQGSGCRVGYKTFLILPLPTSLLEHPFSQFLQKARVSAALRCLAPKEPSIPRTFSSPFLLSQTFARSALGNQKVAELKKWSQPPSLGTKSHSKVLCLE